MSWDWSVGFVRFQTPLRILVTAGALVATLPLALSAADAQPRPKKKPPVTLSTAAPGTLGFTPSVADPKLAATLSRGTGAEKMFRFTPAGSPGSTQPATVAVPRSERRRV